MTIPKEEVDLALQNLVNNDKPDEEVQEIEAKIKELQKGATFTMKLTAPQLMRVKREAESVDLDWKAYLTGKVIDMLESRIGKPTITGPSFFGKSVAQKITGPSNWGG